MVNDYWSQNNITKPKSFVVCAACELDGVIILGARHWDVRMIQQFDMIKNSDQFKEIPAKTFNFREGFIDQFGEFLSREEAMSVAIARGQPVDIERGCGGDTKILYSEGLY